MTRKSGKIWALWPAKRQLPPEAEKLAIIIACETFIEKVPKPRRLPKITPTEFNYVIDIRGDWRAGRYRFMRRYQSGHAESAGWEFDAPFARLDRMAPDRFDIDWMRHTGQWWRLHTGKTLTEALHLVETDGIVMAY